MPIRPRLIVIAAGLLVCGGLAAGSEARPLPLRMVGGAAPALTDSGSAYFAVVHATSTTESAAGTISDKRLGTGAVTYSLKVLPAATGTFKVTAKKVVLYTGKGSLQGTATATITLTKTTETITDGKLKLTKGFGSLAGSSLIATFTGTANLAGNQFAFKYKGKLS
jgi:hypothetical protein